MRAFLGSQVSMDGHLKLTDFGFAKRMEAGAVTCGSRVGTPEYMAPELLRGLACAAAASH